VKRNPDEEFSKAIDQVFDMVDQQWQQKLDAVAVERDRYKQAMEDIALERCYEGLDKNQYPAGCLDFVIKAAKRALGVK
jgi:hypothetical protein